MQKFTDNNPSEEQIFQRFSTASKNLLKGWDTHKCPSKIEFREFVDAVVAASSDYLSLFKKIGMPDSSRYAIKVENWIVDAYYEAYLSDSDTVEVLHLVLSFLLNFDKELYYKAKKEYIKHGISKDPILKGYYEELSVDDNKYDLNLIGREKELTKIIVNLSSGYPKPLLLVGDQGIGKTSLVYALASRIKEGTVPDVLRGARVIRVSFPKLLSLLPYDTGISVQVLFSHLLNSITNVDRSSNGKTILFIDDIRLRANIFFGFGSDIEDKDVLVIGAATGDIHERGFDSTILDMWNIMVIPDLCDEEYEKILKHAANQRSKITGITFSDEAITKIIDIHKNDLALPSLPSGGLRLLDLLSTYKNYMQLKFNRKSRGIDELSSGVKSKYSCVVTEADVVEFMDVSYVEDSAGEFFENVPAEKLLSLEMELEKHVVGQRKVLKSLARKLRVSSLKLDSQPRPVGTFLFLGPTGVGKTETAKALAISLFGYKNEQKKTPAQFLRIDMTEYSEKHSVSKLFGAPPGYVGYDDSVAITDFVRENSVCVLLFDEIDKAHPEVLNSLLHIMDEGEIRDNSGETVSFEDVIILMTSNHGAELIAKSDIGFDNVSSSKNAKERSKEIEKKLIRHVKKHLKPEFLNRFDDVIVFKQLEEKDLLEIVDIMLSRMIESLKIRNIKFLIGKKAKKIIVKKAFSVEYGARELRRVFNIEVIEPISKILLENKNVKEIKVSAKGGALKISHVSS